MLQNPWDELEEKFSKLEEQVTDISHKIDILMETLENKFASFRHFGNSNLEVGFHGKSGDNT